MSAPERSRTESNPRQLAELDLLYILAALGLVFGLMLALAGAFIGNGIDAAPEDVTTKIVLLAIGSPLAAAGFFSLLAALVLSGVKKTLENTAST